MIQMSVVPPKFIYGNLIPNVIDKELGCGEVIRP